MHANALDALNAGRHLDFTQRARALEEGHRGRTAPALSDYPLPALKRRIADALSAAWDGGRIEPQFELIERDKFGGDMAVKFPQLLQRGGPKAFIANHQPWILEVLGGGAFQDAIARIEVKGMYINLTLTDRWLLDSAQAVVDRGTQFGHSDAQVDRRFVIDYSSPNVAKVLHAGHIRSTIIGHVLANLHAACGALVFRVNHINDFGGFGFLLEGWRRFEAHFPAELDDGARLLEIYRIRRTLERHVAARTAFDQLPEEDQALFARYFPEVDTPEALVSASAEYTAAAERSFARLEAGAADEVALWDRMVQWSLRDFQQFYQALRIHIDFVIGESFYARAGDALVEQGLASGRALVYTRERADADQAILQARRASDAITEAEHRTASEAIEKDLGAVVVPIGDLERYVVRRADGQGIYATRDLGAIQLRGQLFTPTDVTYVVGQEQQTHFARLFKAAEVLGLLPAGGRVLQHLHFGFYVDAHTGRKLSSRDSVASVNRLLALAVDHFREKSRERSEMDAAELEEAASQLAVGSLVFNDLKQDVKGAVEIDNASPAQTIAGFEKSGGAYLVYSACRARSILRRHGREPEHASRIAGFQIDAQEASLLLKLQRLVESVAEAAQQSNPTLLVRHLLDIAGTYNAYYMRAAVIVDGVANPTRLLITRAVCDALVNGLKICHVECPPKI